MDRRLSGLRTTSTMSANARRTRSAIWSAAAAGVDERAHLGQEMRPQPRHGGELGAVGDLVQANPQPEVTRHGLEFPFDVDDVRRHQEQLSRVAGEHLVLAENLARQVRQHRPGLNAR